MTIQELNQECDKLYKSIKKEVHPINGLYYVDFKFIERVCNKNANALFIHILHNKWATDMGDVKGLIFSESGLNSFCSSTEKVPM
jgi:hypothetical protein